jgi:hypothetical protein
MDGRDHVGDLVSNRWEDGIKVPITRWCEVFTGLMWFRTWIVASCEQKNDPSGCVNGRKFLDWPYSCELLKMGSFMRT